MNISEWLMATACILFIIAGIAAMIETRNWRTSGALICIGIANALLLWEARA